MYMYMYACIYMCICMCMHICAYIVSFSSDALCAVSSMRLRACVHMYTYAYLRMPVYICMCILFAVSVACILEQVFWALVHKQTYTLYRCLLDIKVHVCDTLAAGCAYVYVHIYMYAHAYVYRYVCASMILLEALRR